MSISTKTQKMLWGRGASRCSICKMELVMDASETDDESLVGENCHIVAKEIKGPRGESDLSLVQRDKYNNLILLCNVHHKQIDDQSNTFTVEGLHQTKSGHEGWVKEQLEIYDPSKQRDEEIYAGYIDTWESKFGVENWKNNYSSILYHGQPSILKEFDESISEDRDWLLNRVWPKRYLELESAFTNFRLVFQDFYNTFHLHSIDIGDILDTEKFYKIDDWNPELYSRLAGNFHEHVSLVQNLALELTRAANYLCDKIRKTLISSYRINEGVLLIESGPNMDFKMETYRAEYRDKDRIDIPYLGLDDFKENYRNRDFHF